jgi:cytochrome c biogenesis protein CcmG/thiol:disulfide interchange protein DsbE
VDIEEGKEKVQEFAQEQGLTFTILLDEDRMVSKDYAVLALPSSLFIDREGVIQARHGGALDVPQIETYVEELLR